MAQATAVQTKIAMIAAIRFNMLGCASTLSARPQPTSPGWCCQVLYNEKYLTTPTRRGRLGSGGESRGTTQHVETDCGDHCDFRLHCGGLGHSGIHRFLQDL